MAQDAQLISQASKVESLASDGLVSVSTGAGQPQKNMELAKFADSLGSSVPLQQTSEQVSITGLYARTSDGKMVELTKESVASVIAGVLGTNGNIVGIEKYYKRKGSALTVEELDMMFDGGDVFQSDSVHGSESVFLVQSYQYGSSSCLQCAIDINTSDLKKYYRKYTSVGGIYKWSAWTYVDNFGYNTLADLSSGVAEQMNKRYNVKTGGEINIEIMGGSGLFLIKNASNTADWDVVLIDYSGRMTTLHKNNDNLITYGSTANGQVCIFKSEGGITIKNNWSVNASIDFRYM